MWVLIAVFLQGASGVSSQSIYFADRPHCTSALEEMQKLMPRIPSATYLFHCAEVSTPDKSEPADEPRTDNPYRKM